MNKTLLLISVLLIGLFILFMIIRNPNIPKTGDFSLITPTKAPPSPTQIPVPTIITTQDESATSSGKDKKDLVTDSVVVTMETSKGTIELLLYKKYAPNTVENFLKKGQSGYYTNLMFHRVEDWVIQGGDPLGNGTGGGEMLTELNDKPFIAGSFGVARKNDIRVSNDSQFFITKKESPHLDRQYTNFGIVTKGMDVVNAIEIGDKILKITIQ